MENEELEKLIEKHRKKEAKKELEKQIKLLTGELEAKDRLIDLYESTPNKSTPLIKPKYKNHDEGTVLTLYSDQHLEEKVTSEETNGLNEHNLKIARKRNQSFFVNLIKLTEKMRADIRLDELLIGMLGDTINGFIHEEYLRSNLLTPPEAALFANEVIEQGLEYLLNYGKFKRISIVCKVGNHSRITDKTYTNDEALMSYEWGIYQMLKKKFPQINWIIDNSYFTYFDVYNKTLRFHHGHGFRYGGGIGGIYVPLMRYRLRINQQAWADLDCMGHWHQSIWLRSVLINGSCVGFNPYAQRKGFEPELPQQQFLIIDKKRGFTINAPIILEDI